MNLVENVLYGNNLRKIRNYLRKNPVDINYQNHAGKTPLINAIRKNRSDITDFFLDFDEMNINLCDSNGMTPLHYACQTSNRKIVETLITKGANGFIKNNSGYTPFHISAFCYQDPNILLLMVPVSNPDDVDNMNRTTLITYSTAMHKNKEIFSILVNITSDINHRDINGYTALHHCCKNGTPNNLIYIHMLIERGCDINIQCIEGKKPFDLLNGTLLENFKSS